MADASAPTGNILEGLQPAPSAPTEFVSGGYRFEHHPDGPDSGIIILSHPGCAHLTCAYGHQRPNECFTLAQAIQLILYALEKDYAPR